MTIKNETELYLPVKSYFESKGYEVKAEIKNCDLIAIHPEENDFTIVELKKVFNLQLIFQAIKRLKLSYSVYVAIEYSPRKKLGSHFSRKDASLLCTKLGIGLIGVQFYKTKQPFVDVLCYPSEKTEKWKSTKRSQRLRAEFDKRSGDYNVGGSTKRKLVTAYRERALKCAAWMIHRESVTPRELREALREPSIAAMLSNNYYGWFERIGKGKYRLSSEGRQALDEYAHIVNRTSAAEQVNDAFGQTD